ncbi:magnesium transporter [Mucor ambiguus]|uniref:Magnesium transporter n=1 Tax=Mucor ambiguus TaxID=91626 RepID=A0A0C9M452_9FUNG|nr:magnesium transporter [Mucor ambiguus]
MSTRKSSIRRRGTGSTSLEGAGATGTGSYYPNYLPVFRETTEPRYDLESPPLPPPDSPTNQHHHRASSFHSFLTGKSLQSALNHDENGDLVEDVKTDVLYPRYKASKDDHVDIAAFNRMVQDRTRKMSTGTLQLSKTLSRQNQLYGSSKNFDVQLPGIRFTIYSSQKNSNISTSLDELLTEQGQKALEAVVTSRGWWLDVLCPSVEEMRVLSKTFHIHPLTTEDIQAQEPREKVELFPNYTFVCFRAFDVDPISDLIKPFNYYTLIFKEGFLTFHFKRSDHCDTVRERCDQLKTYMPITPDWMNYALIDSITDSFAPIILQVEMEAVSIDELSLVLRKSEQADMLKRISRCRKKSTQLARLLGSKLDVIKSLMKRYQDKSREFELLEQQQQSFPVQLSTALNAAVSENVDAGKNTPVVFALESKKAYTDVLLYLGDIQDHVVTMVQNINHYDRILHRAHTNYLAQVNLELTQTYNMTNNVMNRLTFLATVFIPLTLIGSLWGMNVYVPGKDHPDLAYFYWILGGMALYCTGCLSFGKRLGLL